MTGTPYVAAFRMADDTLLFDYTVPVIRNGGTFKGALELWDEAEMSHISHDIKDTFRLVHIREVRDGDPSPEDVDKVREDISQWIHWNALSGGLRHTLRGWLELLGGKP